MSAPANSSCLVLNRKRKWGSGIVEIKVGAGDNTKTFHVYEEIIRTRSAFFEKALNSELEAEKAVLLPTADPAAFALYMDFIHSESIFLGSEDKSVDEEISTLGPAYVLGDILSDHDFKDAIIDAIIHHVTGTENYPFELNQFAFEKTPEKWPLQKLLTHLLVLRAKSTWLTDASKALLTVDALFEALKYLIQVQEKQPTPDFSLAYKVCSNYHCHAQYKAKCYREKLGLASLLSGPFCLANSSPAVKEKSAPPSAPSSFGYRQSKIELNPLSSSNTFASTIVPTSSASEPSSGGLFKFPASQPSNDQWGFGSSSVTPTYTALQPSGDLFSFAAAAAPPVSKPSNGLFDFGTSIVASASTASQPSRDLLGFGSFPGTNAFSTPTALQPSGGMFGWGSSSSTSALSNASTSSLGGFPTGNFAPTTPQLAKKAKQSQPDQKSTVDKRALIPCRHHAKGKCKRDSCPFLHD
ncbi:hypothetical protein BLS_002828 [Venturia inaequalis]|uniref:C3H1-type domain-containing protein n=1 Tax=Venturia inaequalis TaxID=5025 RepID=A0A8H3ZAL6_VENIN|nr:hypothetical protein BLS_002828 [Venturia inaequalis]KAE9985421.1 hypothetical protein EG327_004714 [Venturia inaequalis]RDI87418.1 hypothetical protein Vi05172_g2306 [Venturia inaequalis]